ncbi:MAG: hypothetical protein JNL79_10190 [Myxococcales bacterium]|nr:hypothetical protein [Myxococcales bacterium]
MARRFAPLCALAILGCSGKEPLDSGGDASAPAPVAAQASSAHSEFAKLRATWLAAPALDGSRTSVFPTSAADGFSRQGDHFVAEIPARSPIPADVRYPAAADGAVHVASRGVAISVRPRGASTAAVSVDGGSLVYRGAFGKQADLVHVPLADGDEELVVLREAPKERAFRWDLTLGLGAAGLRLVGGTLEVLDADAIPRLHTAAPIVFDAEGRAVRATLEVEGCAVDATGTIPTPKTLVKPGARVCTVVSRFDDAGLQYPLAFDPAWTGTGNMVKPRRGYQMVSYKTASGTCATGCPMAIGGIDTSATVTNTTEIYQTASGTWLTMKPFTNARHSFAAVNWLNTKILIAGGSTSVGTNATASVEAYDIATNTWSAVGSLPGGARMGLSGAAVRGEAGTIGFVYTEYAQAVFAGGWDGISTYSKKVDAYTDGRLDDVPGPTLGAWPDLVTARAYPAMGGYDQGCGISPGCVSKRFFYVAGGKGATGALDTIELAGGPFSLTPPTWTAGGNLATARWSGAVTQVGNLMWVGGGMTGPASASSDVTSINLATGAVTSVGNLAAARGLGAAAIAQFAGPLNVPVFAGGTPTTVVSGASGINLVDVAPTGGVIPASNMAANRWDHQAASLGDGRVLVAGGFNTVCKLAGCSAVASQYLSTAEIFAPLANGTACATNGDCKSTKCVDGVCCNVACGGQCQACNLPSAVGTCTTVTPTNGPVGYPAGQAVTGFGTARTLCAPFGAPCGASCDGTSPTACALPAVPPVCIAASCGSGVQTNPATCSGGLCPTPTPATKDCSPYACGATACRTTCSDNSHCASGYKCSGAICVSAGTAGAACTVPTDCAGGLSCVDNTCCGTSSCPSGMKCNNPEAPGACKYPKGATCTAGTASLCASGNCVDGYCCDGTCTGQCQACDVAGKLGTCTAVAGDVHGTRTKCTGSGACQAKCDGVNGFSCGAAPGVATVCAAGFCTSSSETPTRYCDGLGTCVSATSKACKEYKCGATSCLSSCSGTTDCATGYTCIGGSCVTTGADGTSCSADDQCTSLHCVDSTCCKSASCTAPARCDATTTGTCARPVGASCTSATECGSGYCVDGFCCNAACDGQCEACDVSKSEGSCIGIAGKPHGSRTACSGTGACQASCDGTVRISCNAIPGSSTTCAAPTCDVATGIAKPAAYCDGAGNCTAPKATACKPYQCDAAACKTVCLAETDCATGYTCKDNACVPKAGVACTGPGDCASGFCVDGVCCNTACTGQCEACDVPGAAGTCSPVTGAVHGTTRTKCSDGGGDACKALACDGSDRTKCLSYANGLDTVCKKAVCADGSLSGEGVCDGKGTCKLADNKSCAPYVCDGADKCKTSCVTSTDCATGFLCASGKCSALTSKCKADNSAAVPLDGSPELPCNGFLCDPSTGKCRDKCTASGECQSGFACDGDRCVPTAGPAVVDDAGGCAYGGPSTRSTGAVVGLLFGLAAVARRRRSR